MRPISAEAENFIHAFTLQSLSLANYKHSISNLSVIAVKLHANQ